MVADYPGEFEHMLMLVILQLGDDAYADGWMVSSPRRSDASPQREPSTLHFSALSSRAG
jgi:hypothetical protein